MIYKKSLALLCLKRTPQKHIKINMFKILVHLYGLQVMHATKMRLIKSTRKAF